MCVCATSWHYKKTTFIFKISSKAKDRDRIWLRNVNCDLILSYHLVSNYVYSMQKWKRTVGVLITRVMSEGGEGVQRIVVWSFLVMFIQEMEAKYLGIANPLEAKRLGVATPLFQYTV